MHKPRIILRLAAVLAIAGALAGTVSFVAAQQFPQTLPPNTVVGRLGAGQAGPAQAVPFGSLTSAANRIMWANDFGAACDGNTEDHVAFQSAVATAQTLGIGLRFIGTCIINTTLNITGAIDFGGISDQLSILKTTSSGIGGQVLVNTNTPVQIHDYGCLFSGPTSLDFCFQTTAPTTNFNSRIWNVTWNAGIAAVIDHWGSYTINNSFFYSNGGFAAVIIRQTTNTDQGDMALYGNQFLCQGGTGIALDWEGGGGLRFENNKVNGVGCTTDIFINNQINGGSNTGDMFIIGNSLEGQTGTTGDCIKMTRASGAGTVGSIFIIGNEGSCQNFVNIPTDAGGQWIHNIVINGNSLATLTTSSKTTFASIDSTTGLIIAHDIVSFNSSNAGNQLVNLGSAVGGGTGSTAAKGCIIGPISTESINNGGTVSGSTLQSCTSITPN